MASNRITIFGGSGFLGRQIVKRLAGMEGSIRVAVRHPERVSSIGRMGRQGQVELVRADVGDESTVAEAVKHSASVINSVGHYVETTGATFDAIHGQGALNVARQAANAGVERLIHISGLGADAMSDSSYVRARGIGEDLVKDAFAGVTILRPGVIIGPDDTFFNTLAGIARMSPVLPLFGIGRTNLQPVFVGDVAEACARVLDDPSTRSNVYELGGPRIYTYKALVSLALEHVGRRRALVPVPFFVWDALAGLLSGSASPPITRDQIVLMRSDNVVGAAALTLDDLGIEPTDVEKVLPTYLDRNGNEP